MTIRLAGRRETRKFSDTIWRRVRQKRLAFAGMFELTYLCNFRCPHCYLSGIRKEKKELNTKKVFSILSQLKEMGTCYIGFTGGEPLMRKDIFDILEFANRRGFKSRLLTNGSLIDEKAAARLKEVNVDMVEITFNSARPEVFDKLSGVKNALKNVKYAIEMLVKKDIQVKIKSLVTSLNKDGLVEMSQYARALNILYRIDGALTPCRNGCAEWVSKYSLGSDELDYVRRQVYPEMFRGNGKIVKARPRPKRRRIFDCGVGINSFTINPYGKMNFCLDIDYPQCDILTEGAAACWEKIKEEVDRINNAKNLVCRTCDLSRYCGWCPAKSYVETGDFNKCSEFCRRQAVSVKTMKDTSKI